MHASDELQVRQVEGQDRTEGMRKITYTTGNDMRCQRLHVDITIAQLRLWLFCFVSLLFLLLFQFNFFPENKKKDR